MFDHEMNYDLDCEISIDSGDVRASCAPSRVDERSWTDFEEGPYNFVAGCWFGGSAAFDVKVEENDDEGSQASCWGAILASATGVISSIDAPTQKAPEPKRRARAPLAARPPPDPATKAASPSGRVAAASRLSRWRRVAED